MKIKENTLKTVLNFPLSKIKDFNKYYYDNSTDSYLFLPYKDDFNFDDGEEVLICELSMR